MNKTTCLDWKWQCLGHYAAYLSPLNPEVQPDSNLYVNSLSMSALWQPVLKALTVDPTTERFG